MGKQSISSFRLLLTGQRGQDEYKPPFPEYLILGITPWHPSHVCSKDRLSSVGWFAFLIIEVMECWSNGKLKKKRHFLLAAGD
ncbi:MAG: hypothetical protein JSV31_05760 [Desulfobacterales bacterium]|nr:MAG: hypothetical protein JSV31_05760 [Desulfobacterales bacterium]